VVEEYASARRTLSGYSNAVSELFRPARVARSEYVRSEPSAETWHFAPTALASIATPSSTGSPAASAQEGKDQDPERPAAGAGATSRVTGAYFADGDQHLDYDTFQEHIAPNTTSDFAFKARSRSRDSVWRGMIKSRRTRRRRRLPGEPEI